MTDQNPEIQQKLFSEPLATELYAVSRADIEEMYGAGNPASDYGGRTVLPKTVAVETVPTDHQPSLFDEPVEVVTPLSARELAAQAAKRAAESTQPVGPLTDDQLREMASRRRDAAATVRGSGVI